MLGSLKGEATRSCSRSGNHDLWGHKGATRIILRWNRRILFRMAGMTWNGGNAYLWIWSQLIDSASIARALLPGIGDTYIGSLLLRRVTNRSMLGYPIIEKTRLAIVWLRHHSAGKVFNILERRSARMLDLPGICLTFRVIPLWWNHNRRFQTSIHKVGEWVSPTPCFMIYDTTATLSVAIMTVVLWITWCALSRATDIAIISRTLIWRWDWSFVQTLWNNSPSGSRRAPQPETLASVKRVCVSWTGLRGTSWMNRSLVGPPFQMMLDLMWNQDFVSQW